jgi:hypothetical protein
MSGCLGDLPGTQRRLLGLRAGLSGPALSRGAAARRLGISVTRAGALERSGLRSLRSGARSGRCGSGAGGGGSTFAPRLASRAFAMPQLQPAVMLSHPPALLPTHQPARQAVKGKTASSEPAGPKRGGNDSDIAGLTAASAVDPHAKQSISSALIAMLMLGVVALSALAYLLRERLATADGDEVEPVANWTPDEPAEPVAAAPAPAPAPAAVAVPATEPVHVGNGNGNANGNGNGNGTHPAEPEPAIAPVAVAAPNGNGNGNGHHANGNGHNGNGHHPVSNGNGNGHHTETDLQRIARPAAIAASGLVSLAVSRMMRGRRRRRSLL